MAKKKVILLWLLLPVAIFLKYGCFDIPKDLVMPKWDVSLNVPIVNKGYTLWDAIKKDTSKLRYYRDAANSGLLYYSDLKQIDKITVGDNLNIGSFSANTAVQFGTIEIANPQPVNSRLLPGDLGLTTGNPFPPIANQVVTKDFDQSQQFTKVVVQSGNLNFKVTNNFPDPIQIVISRIVIRNIPENTIIIDDNPGFVLDDGETEEKNYNLSNKTINGLIRIETTLSSGGSGGNPVIYNANSNLNFSAQVQNFVLDEVTAKIAENTFNISDSYEFDDSTYVQSAVIDRGSLSITANSNIDVGLTATITIPSLKNSSGTQFSQMINLARKQKNVVVQIESLAGYTLSDPDTPGALVNRIKYSVNVISTATIDDRTILKTDDISAKLDISNLYFRSFTGKIKPTSLTVNETTIDLSLGDVQDKLLVNQIDIDNPKIELKLRKSTNVQLTFSGELIGRNNAHTAQLNIPSTTIGSGETSIILNSADVRNFIKSFSGKLPQTITVKGKGVVNPSYVVGTVTSADSVYGTANLEFPMKVSIQGGSFRDSSSVDIKQDQRNEMNKVKSGSLVLEVQNGIAFDASFSARLYDENNRFLMNLPPNRAPNDTLVHIQAAQVNVQGKVTSSTQSKINFSLNGEEITKLTQSKYLISRITFYTAGNNGIPVEFKTSDAINIKAYGSLNYTVEEKK